MKTVVAEPLDEDYKASIETFMGLESVSIEAKKTMLFSTEVAAFHQGPSLYCEQPFHR